MRINFDDLRFAFLPSDLKQPSPFEEAVAAAAPTAGQSVLYHRADGSTARASVRTVNVPPPPPPPPPPVATPHARQGLPIRHEESPAVKPTTPPKTAGQETGAAAPLIETRFPSQRMLEAIISTGDPSSSEFR